MKKATPMTQMYLVSNEELNTLVRRRRLDALRWVREALLDYTEDRTTDFIGKPDMILVEDALDRVEQQVRADHIGYDYQEEETSPIVEDEFAALEEDDGEDDTALDFALAHVEEDDTMRLLDVAVEGEAVEANLEGGEYPAFPSQHTEVAQYTAEDEPEAAEVEVAAPAPIPPSTTSLEEEGGKRNAAAQRLLNREISQIDRSK